MSLRLPEHILHCIVVALFCSGCVAFNVGKPKEFTHVEKHVDIASEPSSVEVVSAEANLQTQGDEAVVSLAADVKEEFRKSVWEESVTVRQRKRLAIGLFPGAAEFMFMPKGALQPDMSNSHGDPRNNVGPYIGFHLAFACSFGVFHLGTTFYSLIVAPSDDWRCRHDFFDPDSVQRITRDGRDYYDVSQSQKLRSLQKFNASERNQIGVSTCFYQTDRGGGAFVSHMGLVGVHKYLAVFVEDPKTTSPVPDGFETRRRTTFATGPYIAELSIPVLGYNEQKRVSNRETQVSFALPALERDSTVEAIVSFRNDDSTRRRNSGGITEQAVRKTDGRQWRFDITLKGKGRKGTNAVPATPPQSVSLPYHIVGIRRDDEGRYEIRVEIRDQSKTFSINHLVRPDIQRMIREDFMERNPTISQQDVRYRINYETDKDGKTLIYTGWAFSVRPVEDGWQYDPVTRNGWVRLRIVGDLSREEAMRWARENIFAIIEDKNVVLVAGEPPPSGATYRCLNSNVSNDGILKVDFEAVQ